MLVKTEIDLSLDKTKLEQYCSTIYNLEQQIEEQTKDLNNQELYISTLDSELNKLYTDIQIKSIAIESESKQLESLKIKHEVSQQY